MRPGFFYIVISTVPHSSGDPTRLFWLRDMAFLQYGAQCESVDFAARILETQKNASQFHSKGNTMNKILATLIAGLFATSAFAQTTTPPQTPAVVKAEAKAD